MPIRHGVYNDISDMVYGRNRLQLFNIEQLLILSVTEFVV